MSCFSCNYNFSSERIPFFVYLCGVCHRASIVSLHHNFTIVPLFSTQSHTQSVCVSSMQPVRRMNDSNPFGNTFVRTFAPEITSTRKYQAHTSHNESGSFTENFLLRITSTACNRFCRLRFRCRRWRAVHDNTCKHQMYATEGRRRRALFPSIRHGARINKP